VTVLQIEHPITSFETWKAAFDRDPVGRERTGVRSYRIYRPVDDPNYVALDLEFDDRATAETFRTALERLWSSPQAAPALAGKPQARIVDVIENAVY